jgi:hypothetical protein
MTMKYCNTLIEVHICLKPKLLPPTSKVSQIFTLLNSPSRLYLDSALTDAVLWRRFVVAKGGENRIMSKPQFAIMTNYWRDYITLDEAGGSNRMYGGKKRGPRFYCKLRTINYCPDQAVNDNIKTDVKSDRMARVSRLNSVQERCYKTW